MGYIYRITNTITKMMYIGQTIQDLNERFRGHCKTRSSCRYLKNAIQKYGKDNFKFELICVCFDSDLDIYEKQYIEKYNTIVPNGYNLKEGGQSGKQNQETKKKISEGLKKGYADGSIEKQRNFLGKKHTDIDKKKISDKLKGVKKSKEAIEKSRQTRMKYKVQQYTLDGIFLNEYIGIRNAAQAVFGHKSAISAVCIGIRKSYMDFLWKYVPL